MRRSASVAVRGLLGVLIVLLAVEAPRPFVAFVLR